MTTLSQIRIVLALILCVAGGCRLFNDSAQLPKGHSPLQAAQPSPDSVAMEIIWARFPANDPVLDDAAWHEIDETQLDPSVRRELLDNGLRAGVISTAVPKAISRVLHQSDSKTENDNTAAKQIAALNNDPIVHGRMLRVRRNQRTEIQASEIYPSLSLLTRRNGELGGRPYSQAQAMYALRVDPQPNRMALVELIPELHCGEPKLRFSGGDDGILRQVPLRERKVFDYLKVSVRLAPGEMLVLMSRPDSGSRLGNCFHTVDSADGPQHKLILIRLAEVPTSDTFTLEN